MPTTKGNPQNVGLDVGQWIGVNYKPRGKKVGAQVGAELNFRVR
jgi:hypothetical protein